MASNAPGNACCIAPHLHEGSPRGKMITLEDGKTTAYFVAPTADAANNEKSECGIVYLSNVFGIFQNSKLMADCFADAGYTTIIPDIFNGDQIPDRPIDFDILEWLHHGSDGKNPHTEEYVDPVVISAIKTLRYQGIERVGSAGYCFGAKYTIRNYRSGIEAGYVAHPSWVAEAELAAITGPLAISAAEDDEFFPCDMRHKSEEILAHTGLPYQITLFQGVEHGFAVRGDMTNKAIKFAREQAFLQAVTWFDEHLLLRTL